MQHVGAPLVKLPKVTYSGKKGEEIYEEEAPKAEPLP